MGLASRAVRNIARRKARVLLAVIAIGISMAIMISIPAGLNATQSAMSGLNDQMAVDYEAQAEQIETTASLIEVGNTETSSGNRAGSSSSTVNESVMETIGTIDGVEAIVAFVSMSEGMPQREDFIGSATPPTDSSEGTSGMPSFPGGGSAPDFSGIDFSDMRSMFSDVVKVLGVDLQEDYIANYSILPDTILEGRNLEAGETGSVLLTENLTAYYDVEVGGTITIENTTFTVVGLYQNTTSQGNRTVYMSLADAQEIYDLGTNVSYLYVYVEDSSMAETIADAISLVYSDISVSTMTDRLEELRAQQERSEETLASAATTLQQTENTATQEMIIAVVATAAIILFVMLYSVKERTKEIGVLKTLGFSKRQVIMQFILEGVIISAIAAAVGAVIGWVGTSTLASLLLPSSTTSSMGGQAAQVTGLSIQPDLAWVVVAFLLVVAIGAVGSLYPAWRASRTRPVEALKNE